AREFSAMLAPYDITIKTLADFPNIPEIKENGITFEENATKKALRLRLTMTLEYGLKSKL
ncbi:hypothetical protein NL524_28660, partial [Klebsiella pneumoniae]|nr:hypothetical protein [Klebsiella pneumoniae]